LSVASFGALLADLAPILGHRELTVASSTSTNCTTTCCRRSTRSAELLALGT
jgi:hypothetical protein